MFKTKMFSVICLLSTWFLTIDSQQITLTRIELKENTNLLVNKIMSITNNQTSETVDTGHIDLTDFQDVQYYGTVYVGSNMQPFKIMFDTGSDVFWIPGPWDMDSCGYGHKTFNPESSTSFADLKKTLDIQYMKGYNRLSLVRDSLTIGSLTVKNQTIGLVESGDCVGHMFDGLMGMSFPFRRGIPPVFETLIKQKLVNSTVFSFLFKRSGTNSNGGELFVGGWNPEYVAANDITFLPVLTFSPTWNIKIDSIQVGSLTLRNHIGILDTGTSLIIGPKSSVMTLADRIGGWTVYNLVVVLCRRIDDLPPLVFVIGGVKHTLTGRELLYHEIDEGLCLLGIGIGNIGLPNTWLLGDFFLSRVYSIHDYGKKRVALIPLRNTKPDRDETIPTAPTTRSTGPERNVTTPTAPSRVPSGAASRHAITNIITTVLFAFMLMINYCKKHIIL